LNERPMINYVSCQCSAAHTYGNITAIIQKKIIDMFPKDLFKTVHVNSKIAHKQLRTLPSTIFKKEKPMFVIRPRIEWDSGDMFMGNTLVNERMTDIYSKFCGTSLEDFFVDTNKKIVMKYKLDRCAMTFDVVLIFSTLMQQINYTSYIKNAIGSNRNMMIETAAESYISPDLLELISQLSGVPIKDASGNMDNFIRYMNQHSKTPVTYRMQGSTNTTEFFRYYPCHIDTTFSSISTDEGEKVGQVMSQYTVSFSVKAEFWGTGLYYLFSEKLKRDMVLPPINDTGELIPIYTDVICAEDFDVIDGWQLFTAPSCKIDKPNDVLDLSPILNASIKDTIDSHMRRGLSWSNFMDIRMRQQGKIMTYGKDYYFDPATKTIHFINCGTYYTYKILIYINVEYVNNIIEDLYDDIRK